MGRFAAILFAVSGTVAMQVVAQAVLLVSVRFIDRHTRGAAELRRTFWISLGAVMPLLFGHLAQVGLWAGFLLWLGALQSYDDAFYFSLVTFAMVRTTHIFQPFSYLRACFQSSSNIPDNQLKTTRVSLAYYWLF